MLELGCPLDKRDLFCLSPLYINTDCAPSRNRTYDPLLKREMLYQLSYRRIRKDYTILSPNFNGLEGKVEGKCARSEDHEGERNDKKKEEIVYPVGEE
jgi:hypothetical protein